MINKNMDEIEAGAVRMMSRVGDAFCKLPDNMQSRLVFREIHEAFFTFMDILYPRDNIK